MKPSEKEDQHFREQELLSRLRIAAEEQRLTAAAEKVRLKELHFMHCPKCGQKLVPENYGAVAVDVCAGCKGLWLDANELDQILASQEQAGPWRKFLKVLGA